MAYSSVIRESCNLLIQPFRSVETLWSVFRAEAETWWPQR